MTTVNTFTHTPETLQALANQVKDLLAEATGHHDLDDYVVTFATNKQFGRYFNKFFSDEKCSEETYHMVVTKVIETQEDE